MTWLLASKMLATAVRVLAGVYVIGRILSLAKPHKEQLFVAFFGALLLGACPLPTFYVFFVEAGWLAFCVVKWQKMDWRMPLYLAIFYEIAVNLWIFLMCAWLTVCFRNEAFLDEAKGAYHIGQWLFLALLVVLVSYIVKKTEMSRREAMKIVDVVVIAGFVATISLSEQPYIELDEDLLDMWLVFSLILTVGILAFMMRRQFDAEHELAELRAAQAESAEREYQLLARTYAENARLFHDLHNHLGILQRLLAHNKAQEAASYLEGLQAPLHTLTDSVWTGDETVDYLIASKAQQAEEVGVRFTAEVIFPQRTNLRGVDLCAVLGNFLDNALEGAEKVEGERWMRLAMQHVGQMLVIKVENSAQPPKENLATSKVKDGLHGWGLASARHAAERYDGIVQTSYEAGIFTALATLSFDAVESL